MLRILKYCMAHDLVLIIFSSLSEEGGSYVGMNMIRSLYKCFCHPRRVRGVATRGTEFVWVHADYNWAEQCMRRSRAQRRQQSTQGSMFVKRRYVSSNVLEVACLIFG
jgi:hypothetical protein